MGAHPSGVFAPIEHFVRLYGLFRCSQQSFSSKRIQLNSIRSNSIIFWWLPHYYPKMDANMHCNKVREYKLEINYGNTFHIWPVWSVWEIFRYIKIHGTAFRFASIESQTHEQLEQLAMWNIFFVAHFNLRFLIRKKKINNICIPRSIRLSNFCLSLCSDSSKRSEIPVSNIISIGCAWVSD